VELSKRNVSHGALPVGKNMAATGTAVPYNTVSPAPAMDWATLTVGADGYVLTCSAAAAEGVAWAAPGATAALAAASLYGNATGSPAVPGAISLGTGLSFAGTVLNAAGGGGTPGGGSGQIQYDNAGSFGGFTMSGDATLVASTGVITIAAGAVTLAKHANLAATSIMGNPTGSAAAPSAITLGANLSFSGSTLVASGSGGGLTSVGLTTPSWLTVTGSPLIANGTLAVSATGGETANQVLATPNGSSGVLAIRALTGADLPSTGLTISEWISGVTAATVTGSGTTYATTLNCSATGANVFTVQMPTTSSAAVTTITISGLPVGATVKITTLQPSSGPVGTIAWAGQTIRWSGGTAGQATATASIGDTFVLYSPATGIVAGSVACPNF